MPIFALPPIAVFPVTETRASRVVGVLANVGEALKGVAAVADDPGRRVWFVGTEARTGGFGDLVRQLDVRPRPVSFRIRIASALDRYDTATDFRGWNNRAWSLSDETTGVSVRLRPRVNQDGTVTVLTTSDGFEIVARLKVGVPFVVSERDGVTVTLTVTSLE